MYRSSIIILFLCFLAIAPVWHGTYLFLNVDGQDSIHVINSEYGTYYEPSTINEQNLCVLANGNDAESVKLGNWYAWMRKLPIGTIKVYLPTATDSGTNLPGVCRSSSNNLLAIGKCGSSGTTDCNYNLDQYGNGAGDATCPSYSTHNSCCGVAQLLYLTRGAGTYYMCKSFAIAWSKPYKYNSHQSITSLISNGPPSVDTSCEQFGGTCNAGTCSNTCTNDCSCTANTFRWTSTTPHTAVCDAGEQIGSDPNNNLIYSDTDSKFPGLLGNKNCVKNTHQGYDTDGSTLWFGTGWSSSANVAGTFNGGVSSDDATFACVPTPDMSNSGGSYYNSNDGAYSYSVFRPSMLLVNHDTLTPTIGQNYVCGGSTSCSGCTPAAIQNTVCNAISADRPSDPYQYPRSNSASAPSTSAKGFFIKNLNNVVRSQGREVHFYDAASTFNVWQSGSGIYQTNTNAGTFANVIVYQSGGDSVSQFISGSMGTNAGKYLPGAVADGTTSLAGDIGCTSPGNNPCTQYVATEFLKAGASATYGSIVEPCAFNTKFPNSYIVASNLLKGLTVLEAYWKSIRMPYEGLLMGDPLTRPWARMKAVLIGGCSASCAQSLTITNYKAPALAYKVFFSGVQLNRPGGGATGYTINQGTSATFYVTIGCLSCSGYEVRVTT
jgi:hypothetical protein